MSEYTWADEPTAMRLAAEDVALFWRFIETGAVADCWEWVGNRNAKGYGKYMVASAAHRTRRRVMAHRLVYWTVVGPIPAEMQIDHLCRNKGCVNPHHLEAVTSAENSRRNPEWTGNRTHCPKGHPYDEANTLRRRVKGYMTRDCRECNRAHYATRRVAKVRAATTCLRCGAALSQPTCAGRPRMYCKTPCTGATARRTPVASRRRGERIVWAGVPV